MVRKSIAGQRGIKIMSRRHAIVDTPVGELTVVAVADAVVGVYFPHHWYLPDEGFGAKTDIAGDPVMEAVRDQLGEYFDGTRTEFDLPTATDGDQFQERVWGMLREIPFGETTTYGEIAERLGNKSLAQAVGQAVGHNPLSIVVACHRVVGRDGRLTGFAGGLKRKQFLLELEEPAELKAARLF